MEMVRRINHKAPHDYMRKCPQLACNTEAPIEMPAHLSILPVAQRFEGFARNDDTRKTIHALSMLGRFVAPCPAPQAGNLIPNP